MPCQGKFPAQLRLHLPTTYLRLVAPSTQGAGTEVRVAGDTAS